MKKITKILSSVLAVSAIMSCFAVSSFAASKQHTMTVSADKTADLVAGDTVTVEIKIDDTEKISGAQYILKYDTTAFTADTTTVSRVEKCIDKPWLDDIKNPDGDWAYYLGNPIYKVDTTAGTIKFAWAGAKGVEAEYAVKDRVIGKFYFQVAENVDVESAKFELIDLGRDTTQTLDQGENVPADSIKVPVTVTFKSNGPAIVPAEFGDNGVVAGGTLYGDKTAITSVKVPDIKNAYAMLFKDGVAKPDTVNGGDYKFDFEGVEVDGSGFTNIIAIIRYNLNPNGDRTVEVGDKFQLKIFDKAGNEIGTSEYYIVTK